VKEFFRRRGEPARDERVVDLDFPQSVERRSPASFGPAWDAVTRVLDSLGNADLAPLAARSPGLHEYDWSAYLTCSVVRMVTVLDALRARGHSSGRVLDFGSYFGNFSLMCALAGYRVDAVDGYRAYRGALDGCAKLMTDAGVHVMDFDDAGYDLSATPDGAYDAILFMGIIEHLPHTPRPTLETLNRVLCPGGLFVVDTPNLAYLYTRRKLARGETVFPPIERQYYTEVPFEGHHREYTVAEVRWMLMQLGHTEIAVETFNYSQFALGRLEGDAVDLYDEMQRDPSARELIFAVSRKPVGG
jgi:2-polyprenyl-3-methyl-5-hydroxy-6-metoxy-1,4-benzoquinol methylase